VSDADTVAAAMRLAKSLYHDDSDEAFDAMEQATPPEKSTALYALEVLAARVRDLEAERDHLRAEVAALRGGIERISDDYIPSSDRETPLALLEMRSALSDLLQTPQPKPQPEPPQPRTVREWLETIPCPKWRAAALRNMESPADEERSLRAALLGAFNWDDSPEGHDAWNRVYSAVVSRTPLPPCPFGKEGA